MLEFTITVSLVFQYEHIKKITLKGNVVFPLVAFKPDFIKLPKIPAGCVVKAPFKLLNNNTDTTNYLQFALSDYPEFTVRNKQGDKVNTTKVPYNYYTFLFQLIMAFDPAGSGTKIHNGFRDRVSS